MTEYLTAIENLERMLDDDAFMGALENDPVFRAEFHNLMIEHGLMMPNEIQPIPAANGPKGGETK